MRLFPVVPTRVSERKARPLGPLPSLEVHCPAGGWRCSGMGPIKTMRPREHDLTTAEHRRDLQLQTRRTRPFRSPHRQPWGRFFFPAGEGAGRPRGRSRSSSDPTAIPMHDRDSPRPQTGGVAAGVGGWGARTTAVAGCRIAPPEHRRSPPPAPEMPGPSYGSTHGCWDGFPPGPRSPCLIVW